jgi:hypothetical protein
LKYLRSVIQQNSLCDLESGKKKKIDWWKKTSCYVQFCGTGIFDTQQIYEHTN